MINVNDVVSDLPDTGGCVVVLSGGMDSTIALRLAVAKYGCSNVHAITFNYGQRQRHEINLAALTCCELGVDHHLVDASFLYNISLGFSANVDTNIEMPTIKDVLGDPTPVTYVPNRNMILLSITAAYAETKGVTTVICGLQVHDLYSYWDTTQSFIDGVNAVFEQNRKIQINLIAPFARLSKTDELQLLEQLDGSLSLLVNTITCYDPNEDNESCGRCPSCSERIKAFMDVGVVDPIAYSVEIPWADLTGAHKCAQS